VGWVPLAFVIAVQFSFVTPPRGTDSTNYGTNHLDDHFGRR